LEEREIYRVIGLSALGWCLWRTALWQTNGQTKGTAFISPGLYPLVFVFDCFIFSTKGTATLCRIFGWSFPFSPLDYLKGSTFGAFPLGNCLPSYVLSFSERAHSIHHRALGLEPFYAPDGQRLQTLRPFDGCLSCVWDTLLFVLKEIAFPPWRVKTDTTAKGREVIDLKVPGLIGRMHKNKGSSLWDVFVVLFPALY